MSTYKNEQGQLDAYFRMLPRTDDPADCMRFLVDLWRGKREAEAALAGGPPVSDNEDEEWNRMVAQSIVEVEEEAITTLLDALAGTQPVEGVPDARSKLLAAAVLAEETIREHLPVEALDAIKDDPGAYDAVCRTRIALEAAIQEDRP